jgi:hypothetical protein
MSKFAAADFTPENATRLSVIIMPKIGKAPLTGFKSLGEGQQKKFNRLMNEYIQSLGENWELTLLADFNTVVNEDILNDEFNAGKHAVPEMNSQHTLFLSPEQKEFFATCPDELHKITGGNIIKVDGTE